MRKPLIIGLISAAVLAAAALAQTGVVQNTISTNEVFRAAQGPGGPEAWIGIQTIRNGQHLLTTSGSGAATSTAAGGTLMWIGTAPTTWAVTLPSPAFAGEQVRLTTDTTLTTMVTVTAGGSDSLHATYNSQTLTALTPVVFQYRMADTTWYRIQ